MSPDILRNGWEIYQFPPALILGFHGCDRAVGEAILSGDKRHLSKSDNDYDWLGTGVYFWDSNPLRALQFAEERAKGGRNSRGKVIKPFILGAVIRLGHCLNLSDSSALNEVQESFYRLQALPIFDTFPLPVNGKGMKLRRLDRAVFELLHQRRADAGKADPYDTVRGTYREGEPLYPGTDLSHQDHTQICVRNLDCILGYFRPINVLED